MGQGAGPQVGSGVAQSQAPQMLELQEDEVEWGDGGCDPALQHALAVIKAKGGHPHCMLGSD